MSSPIEHWESYHLLPTEIQTVLSQQLEHSINIAINQRSIAKRSAHSMRWSYGLFERSIGSMGDIRVEHASAQGDS
jgi:hypothetical protein